jgi:hypothetical protein
VQRHGGPVAPPSRARTGRAAHVLHPVIRPAYDESFADLSAEVRQERFGQHDHIRNFSLKHLPETIGMIFEIETSLARTLPEIFGEEVLRRYNIPESRWRRFNGACLFPLTKDRLKLA